MGDVTDTTMNVKLENIGTWRKSWKTSKSPLKSSHENLENL